MADTTILVAGERASINSAYVQLAKALPTWNGLGSLSTFRRKVLALGSGPIAVDSLDDLVGLLTKESPLGATNATVRPIRAELAPGNWTSYPNGERLREAIPNCELSKRAFAERIAALAKNVSTDGESGELVISHGHILALQSKVSRASTLDGFRDKIQGHIDAFKSVFDGMDGAPSTTSIVEAFAHYDSQKSKARFICAMHGPYFKSFTHIHAQGCPQCADAAARASRREDPEDKQVRRRDRLAIIDAIAVAGQRWGARPVCVSEDEKAAISIPQRFIEPLRRSLVSAQTESSFAATIAVMTRELEVAPQQLDGVMSVWTAVLGKKSITDA